MSSPVMKIVPEPGESTRWIVLRNGVPVGTRHNRASAERHAEHQALSLLSWSKQPDGSYLGEEKGTP